MRSHHVRHQPQELEILTVFIAVLKVLDMLGRLDRLPNTHFVDLSTRLFLQSVLSDSQETGYVKTTVLARVYAKCEKL